MADDERAELTMGDVARYAKEHGSVTIDGTTFAYVDEFPYPGDAWPIDAQSGLEDADRQED